MPRWIYLSHSMDASTPAYGNRPGFVLRPQSRISKGDSGNSDRWELPNHLGTHFDFPRHFFDHGNSLEAFDPSAWVFDQALLVDCPQDPSGLVTAEALEQALPIAPGEPCCLLVRTGFEKHRGTPLYWERNPGVHPDVANWLRQRLPTVRVLGIDVLSVSRWQDRETGRAAHRALLDPARPLLVIEDMALAAVPRTCTLSPMIALPLHVGSADGAPCTVIAQVNDD